MACADVLSNFEVRLSEDIVNDLVVPGKVFRIELTDVDSLPVPGGCSGLALRQSIHLEKINDTLIKLFVTVYKSDAISTSIESGMQTTVVESGQMSSQTSNTEWLRTGKTQTCSTEFTDVGSTQTNCAEWQNTGVTQTDMKSWLSVGQQTNGEEWSSSDTTQTDGAAPMSVTGSQTCSEEFANSNAVQTDSTEWMCAVGMQTSIEEWMCAVGVQTSIEEWMCSSGVQTDIKTLASADAQTDSSEWLCATAMQTTSEEWMCVAESQTDLKALASSAVQTETNLSSVITQTDSHLLCSTVVQTDESRVGQTFAEIAVETSFNISTQVDEHIQAVATVSSNHCQTTVVPLAENGCQVTAEVTCGTMQTECNEVHSEMQTDLSVAWRSEAETQVVVEVSEATSQAVVDIAAAESQTFSSMALMAAQESQTVQAESAEVPSQTELDVVEVYSQTEMNMSTQTDAAILAISTVSDAETQYDPLPLDVPSAPPVDLPNQFSAIINESFDDYAVGTNDITNTSFSQPVDRESCEASAQTDPVTIIIGDASFLVKQLKSSAINPSRVTTSGNEIEIELSADSVAETPLSDAVGVMMPSGEEKENEMLRHDASTMQAPATPGRSGGVRCRGGLVTSPVSRMPVTSAAASQPSRSPAARPPGFLVRPPPRLTEAPAAPQPVIEAVVAQPIAGPQPVVGGAFSCPFCALTFIDSPALYEHLSICHTVDQQTKWKQPRGRTGKTIVPKKKTTSSATAHSSDEREDPPVLTPIEPLNVTRRSAGEAEKDEPQEGGGLFEDPVEEQVTKKPRGRTSKSGTEDEPKHRPNDTGPPAKRARTSGVGTDDEEDESEAAERQQDAKTPATPGRRSVRSTRGRKKS